MRESEPSPMADKARSCQTDEVLSAIWQSSWGRLLARLAAFSRDIEASEDALADAFASAAKHWAQSGIPHNREGWLYRVAKNRLLDAKRSAFEKTRHHQSPEEMEVDGKMGEIGMIETGQIENDVFPDERLKLMFACTHPAIDKTVHTPLMLQTVLGIEAQEIAALCLIPTSTLAQRLVRAKRKIRDAGIPFEVPEREHLNNRLEGVLAAIYGAYALGHNELASEDIRQDRGVEAVHLVHVLLDMLPDEPEVLGLAALIFYSIGRDPARYDAEGEYVPLEAQDIALWDDRWLNRADTVLAKAETHARFGPYQIEAAIQSVHCDRRKTGQTNWHAIIQLYEGLISVAPSVGAAVARAAAVGQAYGAEAGLRALAVLDAESLKTFQPALATKAHLLAELGDVESALTTFDKAISLTTSMPLRRYLTQKADRLRR